MFFNYKAMIIFYKIGKIMSKKIKAFTLTETLMVLMLIGVVATITIASVANSDEMQKRKLRALSRTLFIETQYNYQIILFKETRGFNVLELNSSGESGIEADSSALEEMYEKYQEVWSIPCSRFPRTLDSASYLSDKMTCAASSRGFYMGFYLDKACDETYDVIEYLQDDVSIRTVENACGYIIYTPKRSRGILGDDFFVIGLDKKGMK